MIIMIFRNNLIKRNLINIAMILAVLPDYIHSKKYFVFSKKTFIHIIIDLNGYILPIFPL